MRIKRFVMIIVVLAVISIMIFNTKNQSKTTFNEDNVQGNSGGNLLNGGLFCELDDKIFFSNPNDDGAIYSMNVDATDFKKIYEDKGMYLNAAGKYIYYTRRNDIKKKESTNALEFNNKGIYRINKDGSNIKRIYSGLNENMKLYGNYIYYEHSTSEGGLTLYKNKIDGNEEQSLSNEAISPTSIIDGIIYYSGIGQDHNINTFDLTTNQKATLLVENTMNTIATDDYIYYISLADNYSIHRINKDGTNPVNVVPDRCSSFNISLSGKYLYYQIDNNEDNGIHRLNTETNEVKTIISGNYNKIHTTSNFVFFQEFRSDTTFILPIGENGDLSIFNPPILD